MMALRPEWAETAEPGEPAAISGPGRGYAIDRAVATSDYERGKPSFVAAGLAAFVVPFFWDALATT